MIKTLALLFLLVTASLAQTSSAPVAASTNPPDLQMILQSIDQTAQTAALDLARLRVDKWKTDGDIKQQSQSNADSLSRNISTALPAIVNAVRTSPQDLAATFKLYRNLNALYDVLEGLTQSSGAFGPKQEFEILSQHVAAFESYRRSLGDYLEALATSKDAELRRLRGAGTPSSQSTRPKKIIVDNDPVRKPSKKKQPQ
ncbi:MAG TPA: hypothetical protein VM056_02365 [Terriglobales bacterium]|nr:hypothetical protein [Terriglobales bacterium]